MELNLELNLMFKKILIANRGEIACRIIQTAKKLGIKTIAVYSTIDQKSLHVQMADEAFLIGAAESHSSYLNIAAIINAAKLSNADAIHPGYGFLSENAALAQACLQANITWIGPSIDAMQLMASKQRAKQHVTQFNIPVIPGYFGQDQTDATLLSHAQSIGFPIIIKAALGGGGKGMRTIYHLDDFMPAIQAARREAQLSFADATLLIEKYLPYTRHIEVQILADQYDNIIHLATRDCSIQRRHQKIIEEAPAPDLSPELTNQLTTAAINIARSINYHGAGTIEFLLDDQQNFYFMEMNTRLQVEHPVTEMLTNIDLVEWQLRIANKQLLTLNNIQTHGHAIECRIYAEDPAANFLPSIGFINYVCPPTHPNIRIDTGIISQTNISQYYDPLLSKIIAWGETRQEAIQTLTTALNNYYINGIKTNLTFLQAILHNEIFLTKPYYTNFLTQVPLNLPTIDYTQIAIMCACFDYAKLYANPDALTRDTIGWQMYATSSWQVNYLINNTAYDLVITPISATKVKINSIELVVNDYLTTIHEWQDTLTIYHNTNIITAQRNKAVANNNHHLTSASLTSAIPSTIIAILKNIGDSVETGDKLIILEAMKMEHTIIANKNGVITDIFYSVGSQIQAGVELIQIK
jgi:3-methylcrotonyl-CoA carboxylase alpha subunit